MLDSIENGEWFLPSTNIKIPGRLFFSDKENKIILETFGDKYLSGEPVIIIDPKRDKKYHSKNYNNSYQHKYPLINGDSRNKITLYNCSWSGTEDIGKELYLMKYEVQFVFWGIHVKSVDNFYINSATLKYPYLGSWYDGWETIDKMEIFEKSDIGRCDYKTNLDQISPISIPGGADIFIYDSFSKRIESIGVHHSMKYEKLLKFEYNNSILFKNLINDIFNFNRLLEFCHGKPLKRKLLNVKIKEISSESSQQKIEYLNSTVGNYTFHNGEEIPKHSQHQRHMLISKWGMEKSELDNLIKKWFSNSKFYNIYDIYIDSNNWFQNSKAILSNIMFNNRFLNIVQGLESYYIKVLKLQNSNKDGLEKVKLNFEKNKKDVLLKIENKKLKEWCNSNLSLKKKDIRNPKLETILFNIILSFDDVISPIFGENDMIKYFPKFASKVRNNLSHGLNDETDQGDALRAFFQIGQILLAVCILKTLEVNEIKNKIIHYDNFERYIYEIRSTRLVINKSET